MFNTVDNVLHMRNKCHISKQRDNILDKLVGGMARTCARLPVWVYCETICRTRAQALHQRELALE